MSGKDITQKSLESSADVFADIYNTLAFDGKEILNPADLQEARQRSDYSASDGIREQERDSSKFWMHTCFRIAYLGIENETHLDKIDIPFRIIGYDGSAYRDQIGYYLGDDEKRHKTSERFPVCTLVLNMSYKTEYKNISLLESLKSQEHWDKIPEELKPLIQDYKVNVYNIAFLPDETIDKFKSDFWFLADYLRQMRKTGTIDWDNPAYMRRVVHVREVMNMMRELTHDEKFNLHIEEAEKGDEPKTMKSLLDIVWNDELQEKLENTREEGRKEGREEGREETRKETRKETRDQDAAVFNYLYAAGRINEMGRYFADPVYQEELIAECAKAQQVAS